MELGHKSPANPPQSLLISMVGYHFTIAPVTHSHVTMYNQPKMIHKSCPTKNNLISCPLKIWTYWLLNGKDILCTKMHETRGTGFINQCMQRIEGLNLYDRIINVVLIERTKQLPVNPEMWKSYRKQDAHFGNMLVVQLEIPFTHKVKKKIEAQDNILSRELEINNMGRKWRKLQETAKDWKAWHQWRDKRRTRRWR